MNDWTAETANGYEAMQQREENFINRIKAQFAEIQAGDKIFFYNNRFRRNDWASVKAINPTSAHIGFVTTMCGKQIWADEIKIVHSARLTETLQICLNDRQKEFRAAIDRADNSRLEIFSDFTNNHFVVVNKDDPAEFREYRVRIASRGGRVYASCECKDFSSRSRICKHIAIVLLDCRPGLFPEYQEICPVCESPSENGLTHWDCALLGKAGIRKAKADLAAWRYLNEVV